MRLPLINRSPRLFSLETSCALAETLDGAMTDPGAGCPPGHLGATMPDSPPDPGAPSNGLRLFRRGTGFANTDPQGTAALEMVLILLLVAVVLLVFAGWGIYEGVGKLRRIWKGKDAEEGMLVLVLVMGVLLRVVFE